MCVFSVFIDAFIYRLQIFHFQRIKCLSTQTVKIKHLYSFQPFDHVTVPQEITAKDYRVLGGRCHFRGINTYCHGAKSQEFHTDHGRESCMRTVALGIEL